MEKVIDSYSVEEAIEDGILTLVGRVEDKPVVVTTGVRTELPVAEWQELVEQFLLWQRQVEPTLAEEDRLFRQTASNGQTVWVLEDGAAITVLYPDEY